MIVIGGMQRSGTSLLRAIIGSHPDVAMFQWDLPFWTELQHHQPDPRLLVDHYKHQRADHHVDPARLATGDWPSIFEAFMAEYARLRGRPRWGLKTPGNELHITTIHDQFPHARVVALVRDPRAVAASHQRVDDGSWRYDPWKHMAAWKQSVEAIRQHECLATRYEDLTANTEETVRRVCDYVELDFDPVMLEMKGHPGWTGHNSSFGAPSIEPPDNPTYSRVLGDLMAEWGYTGGRPTTMDRAKLTAASATVMGRKQLIELVRRRAPWLIPMYQAFRLNS